MSSDGSAHSAAVPATPSPSEIFGFDPFDTLYENDKGDSPRPITAYRVRQGVRVPHPKRTSASSGTKERRAQPPGIANQVEVRSIVKASRPILTPPTSRDGLTRPTPSGHEPSIEEVLGYRPIAHSHSSTSESLHLRRPTTPLSSKTTNSQKSSPPKTPVATPSLPELSTIRSNSTSDVSDGQASSDSNSTISDPRPEKIICPKPQSPPETSPWLGDREVKLSQQPAALCVATTSTSPLGKRSALPAGPARSSSNDRRHSGDSAKLAGSAGTTSRIARPSLAASHLASGFVHSDSALHRPKGSHFSHIQLSTTSSTWSAFAQGLPALASSSVNGSAAASTAGSPRSAYGFATSPLAVSQMSINGSYAETASRRPIFGRSHSDGLRIPTRSGLASLPEDVLTLTVDRTQPLLGNRFTDRASVVPSSSSDWTCSTDEPGSSNTSPLCKLSSCAPQLTGSNSEVLPGNMQHQQHVQGSPLHRHTLQSSLDSGRSSPVSNLPSYQRRGSASSQHSLYSDALPETSHHQNVNDLHTSMHQRSLSAASLPSQSRLPSLTDPDVAEAVRRAAEAVIPSSNLRMLATSSVGRSGIRTETYHGSRAGQVGRANAAHTIATTAGSSGHGGLMGNVGTAFFGKIVRERVDHMLHELLPRCTSALEDDTVNIVEYDALGTNSPALVKSIVQRVIDLRLDRYSARMQSLPNSMDEGSTTTLPAFSVVHADAAHADFRPVWRDLENLQSETSYLHMPASIFPSSVGRSFGTQIAPHRSVSIGFNLMNLHFRRTPLISGTSAHGFAHADLRKFLEVRANEFKKDGLLVLAFIQKDQSGSGTAGSSPAFSTGSPTLSPGLEDQSLGLTLSRSRFPTENGLLISDGNRTATQGSPSGSPSANFSGMLSRIRSGSSPGKLLTGADGKHDGSLWSTIPILLAPCIQRMVATGLIKTDIAHKLLALPLYPRSALQTQATLATVSKTWQVAWSCGLGESDTTPLTPTSGSPNHMRRNSLGLTSVSDSTHFEDALRLEHPAYTAYQATTFSDIHYAEHTLQFIRTLYESHFRSVLRDDGKLGRGKIEEALDALNSTLREKLEDTSRPALALEFDVCIVALRRL